MRPLSRACPTSSEPVALQPDRPGFCPSYCISHYWQNPWRLGGPAPTLDELGQVRDRELLRDGEPRPEIVPEAETELGTGLGQAEEGIPAIASDVAAGSAAHLAPGHLGADVVLRSVGVQRDLGMVEHPE